eukprot:TRINITY_DN2364_c0_g1_i3.p1 TRINITY_DN2364_c0_g1~~TRINITY_DN2364_c0_g1_i3.p1  ORF type:complete len:232 (-),score=42.06 TRINITY_DN2364_c0_g1_i3:126-821(-)
MRKEMLVVIIAVVSLYTTKTSNALSLENLPGDILDLNPFTLQLPIDNNEEIHQPQLNTYSNYPYFYSADNDYVTFLAFVNGSHTPNSLYERTELSENKRWNSSGTSKMTVKEAYIHLPKNRPELVGAQIHTPTSGVVLQVRLNYPNLVVLANGGFHTIQENYQLGTVHTVELEVINSQITVYLNGENVYSYKQEGTGWYFKAGAYVQSNLKYDEGSEYGQVDIYSVSISHS